MTAFFSGRSLIGDCRLLLAGTLLLAPTVANFGGAHKVAGAFRNQSYIRIIAGSDPHFVHEHAIRYLYGPPLVEQVRVIKDDSMQQINQSLQIDGPDEGRNF